MTQSLIRNLFAKEFENVQRCIQESDRKIRKEFIARGALHSSMYIEARYKLRLEALNMLLNKRIEIERDINYKKGEFLTQENAETLKKELDRILTNKHEMLVKEMHDGFVQARMQGNVPDRYRERINKDVNGLRNSTYRDIDIWLEEDKIKESRLKENGTIGKVQPLAEDLDSMTQIYNKGKFEKDIEVISSKCKEEEKPFSLIMIDVDNFKNINDTYGHSKGDDVLKEISKRLKFTTSGKGKAYRYGGEEFIILLENYDSKEAEAIAERIRGDIEKLEVKEIQDRITVSLGVATSPDTNYEVKKLIDFVDKAMYESKESGRNRVTVYKTG